MVTQRRHRRCVERTYQPGQAFVHPAGPHNFRNDTDATLKFGVAYFVPVGATLLTAVDRSEGVRVRRLSALIACCAVAAAVPGCGDGDEPRRASAAARPLPTAVPEVDAELGRPTTVPGTANIYGAGREHPPAPAGGGPGVLPPRWFIPGAGAQGRHLPPYHRTRQPDQPE